MDTVEVEEICRRATWTLRWSKRISR